MESKFADESKAGESKFGEAIPLPKALQANDKKLSKLMGKRENGDILANLYPFYQRKIADELDAFFNEYALDFDFDSDEHKLCYTDIFKKYERLFEGYLSEFIEEQNLDERSFYDELNMLIEGSKSGRSKVLVKMLAAQTDYDFFVNLMKDKARGLAKSEAPISRQSNKK